MEEKKVEEILQDEEIPVTEEASGEGEAVQAQDAEVPETETAESDTEAGEACAEETEEAESEADSDENNTDGEKKGFFSKLKKGDKEKAAMEENFGPKLRAMFSWNNEAAKDADEANSFTGKIARAQVQDAE